MFFISPVTYPCKRNRVTALISCCKGPRPDEIRGTEVPADTQLAVLIETPEKVNEVTVVAQIGNVADHFDIPVKAHPLECFCHAVLSNNIRPRADKVCGRKVNTLCRKIVFTPCRKERRKITVLPQHIDIAQCGKIPVEVVGKRTVLIGDRGYSACHDPLILSRPIVVRNLIYVRQVEKAYEKRIMRQLIDHPLQFIDRDRFLFRQYLQNSSPFCRNLVCSRFKRHGRE